MRLPFFNINDSYPLTLGVSDDYFTLSTRLKRLGCAPMQPRRWAAWVLGVALLVSFTAVVPFRLTARAQTEQKAAQLSGIVRDQNGQPVVNATVYLSLRNRAEPLETTNTSSDGSFYFTSAIEENRLVVVWADAGARGLGLGYISQDKSGVRSVNPIIAPPAPVKLLLVAPDGTRAANLRLRVGQMGPEVDEQWIVPRPLAQKLQAQTNARGEAVFAGLPSGQIAQFWLNDQKYYPTDIGFGDLRGGQYAPLSADESVKVGRAKIWKTIKLVAPLTLRGRVTTPVGVGKSGALVLAQQIGFDGLRPFEGATPTAQTRADADGNYEMKGLRPSRYLVEVESEPWLVRDYVNTPVIRELGAPVERVDLRLIRGGVVRGVVLQKGNRKPLAGQSIAMIDYSRKYQYQKTDAQGRFQFHCAGGWAYLWTQKDGVRLPAELLNKAVIAFEAKKLEFYEEKAGKFVWDNVMTDAKLKIGFRMEMNRRSEIIISASELVSLPVKFDATRSITIESAIKPAAQTATLTGTISRPDGQGVSAIVMVRPDADTDYKRVTEKPTDARGRYSITGLKPGRYKIIAQLNDATKANWAAPKIVQTVNAGANRAEFKLSRGALIRGTVIAPDSKTPAPNIEVLTADEDGEGTIVKTDTRGQFEFRVAPGAVAVRLHASGAAPERYALKATKQFDFKLKDGDKRQIQFELSLAGTGAITGTARDEAKRPIAGVRVWAYAPKLHQFNGPTTLTTDADGKYRFGSFPVGGKVAIIALPGRGYSTLPEPGDGVWGLDFRSLAAGQTRVINVTMRAAPATLAGKILTADGSLAVGYHISPQNMKRTGTTTKANGKFWLAGVFSGPRDVYVYDPMSRKRWGPYRAADNQRDLVLRLSEKKRDKNYVLGVTKD